MDRQSVPPLDCAQHSQSPTQELCLSLFQKGAQRVPPGTHPHRAQDFRNFPSFQIRSMCLWPENLAWL